jgi:AAA+ superfamily predicted ATPase
MHQRLKDGLNKIQDLVAHPNFVKTTKVARGAMEVAAQIGMAKIGGPMAVAGAVMGTMNVIQNTFNLEKNDPLLDFIIAHPECKPISTSLPKLVENVGAFNALPLQVFARRKDAELVGLVHDGKRMFFRRVNEKFDTTMWVEDGFDQSILSSAIWSAVGKPIVKLMTSGDNTLDLEGSDYDDAQYVGSHSVAKFAADIEKYRRRNISRAALLYGPAGTGKTSFVRCYARDTNQTLMVVPPDFLSSSSRMFIERLVKLMDPDILLVDDIDRAAGGLAYAMDMTDALRRARPRMVLVTTVNRLAKTNAALLRPGRTGAKRAFGAPPSDEKLVVLELYLERYGVDASTLRLDELVAAMTHKNFSHDYVRFVAEEAVVQTHEELLVTIADLNQALTFAEYLEPDTDFKSGNGGGSQLKG